MVVGRIYGSDADQVRGVTERTRNVKVLVLDIRPGSADWMTTNSVLLARSKASRGRRLRNLGLPRTHFAASSQMAKAARR
jgi:hypothetical protein